MITSAVIGTATVCPFPAFAAARIESGSSLVAGGGARYGVLNSTHQSGCTVIAVPVEPSALVAAAAPASDTEDEVLVTELLEMFAKPLVSLTAAAAGLAPAKPPVDWFDDPELDALTSPLSGPVA